MFNKDFTGIYKSGDTFQFPHRVIHANRLYMSNNVRTTIPVQSLSLRVILYKKRGLNINITYSYGYNKYIRND